MKTLYTYLQKHLILDCHAGFYGIVALFWVAVLVFNYQIFPHNLGFGCTVERYITNTFFFSESYWNAPAFMLFYAIPYFFTLFLSNFFYKKENEAEGLGIVTSQKAVWLRVLFGIACMAFCGSSHTYIHLTDGIEPAANHYFFRKILATFTSYFYVGLPLFLFWYFYDKKNNDSSPNNFYGLTLKNWQWQPYFIIVGFIVVGISIAAVLLPQLTDYYPTLKVQNMQGFDLMPLNLAFAIYEFIYGCFYTWAEVLMRGFLVIGMTHLLGRRAIMPMVSMYLFFHLAKPPAEAISSIFGGYILGVIAYESRNITGGVLLHASVAVGMDIAARIVLMYV